MDFFQNTCFRKHSIMAVSPNIWITINLYKKYYLPQNKTSKQVVSMICKLGKDFFAAATFKGL